MDDDSAIRHHLLSQEELIGSLRGQLETMRSAVAKIAVMLSIYEEEPDANGQRSFNGCMMDAAAADLVSIAFPLREMCRHKIDEQAGCCRICGINIEDIQVGIVVQ